MDSEYDLNLNPKKPVVRAEIDDYGQYLDADQESLQHLPSIKSKTSVVISSIKVDRRQKAVNQLKRRDQLHKLNRQ
jgi:hypothetical protein